MTSDESNTATVVAAKPKKLWLYLAGVALIGTYAAMFIPALAGERVDPTTGPPSMILTGIFFYLLWKVRGRKSWQGALLGAVVGVAIFGLAAFVGGYMRHG